MEGIPVQRWSAVEMAVKVEYPKYYVDEEIKHHGLSLKMRVEVECELQRSP